MWKFYCLLLVYEMGTEKMLSYNLDLFLMFQYRALLLVRGILEDSSTTDGSILGSIRPQFSCPNYLGAAEKRKWKTTVWPHAARFLCPVSFYLFFGFFGCARHQLYGYKWQLPSHTPTWWSLSLVAFSMLGQNNNFSADVIFINTRTHTAACIGWKFQGALVTLYLGQKLLKWLS